MLTDLQNVLNDASQWDESTPALEVQKICANVTSQFRACVGGWGFALRSVFVETDEKKLCLLFSVISARFPDSYRQNLEPIERAQLRQLMKELFLNLGQESAHSYSDSNLQKLTRLYVAIFKVEYLLDWASFFHDLLAMVSRSRVFLKEPQTRNAMDVEYHSRTDGVVPQPGMQQIVLYLQILSSIGFAMSPDQVGTLDRGTDIKDRMREEALTALIPSLFNLAKRLGNHRQASKALDAMTYFIGWADINLFVNAKNLAAVASFLEFDLVRESAVEFYIRVLDKSCSDLDKLRLLLQLQLPSLIESIPLSSESHDLGFQKNIARLIDEGCCELRSCLERLPENQLVESDIAIRRQGATLAEQMQALAVLYFGHDDADVADRVYNCVLCIIRDTKRSGLEPTDAILDMCATIIPIIRKRITLDGKVKGNDPEDQHSERILLARRRDLNELCKFIFAISPERSAKTLQAYVDELESLVESPDLKDGFAIEAVLKLLCQVGGCTLFTPEYRAKYFVFVRDTIVKCCKWGLFFRSEPCVRIALFELLNVFHRDCFNDSEDELRIVLATVLDVRCLGSLPAERVKCLYILNRIVKACPLNHSDIGNTILIGIKALICDEQVMYLDSKEEEEENLWMEITGYIVGHLPSDIAQADWMEIFLSPPIARLERYVNEKLYHEEEDTSDGDNTPLTKLISSISCFAKGTERRNNVTSRYYSLVLELLMQILSEHSPISFRHSLVTYLFRMVDCLGIEMLDSTSIAFSILLNDCDEATGNDLSKLACHIFKFGKVAAFDFADQLFSPLTSFFNDRLANKSNFQSARDYSDFLASYYQFLQEMIGHGLAAVFVSPRNIETFPSILNVLRDGCTSIGAHPIQRKAFSCVHQLLKAWADSNALFTQYFFENVLPLQFELPLHPRFDLDDANNGNIMTLQACLLQEANARFPERFISHLREQFFPKLLQTLPVIDQAANTKANPQPVDFVESFIALLAQPAQMRTFMRQNCQEFKTRSSVGG